VDPFVIYTPHGTLILVYTQVPWSDVSIFSNENLFFQWLARPFFVGCFQICPSAFGMDIISLTCIVTAYFSIHF
jgi:hypothetical protein